MPKASRFSGLLTSRLTKIALRIRNRMNQLNLNEGELAQRCNNLALDIFPDEQQPRLSRERIAKILMNCKARPEKSAAKVISPQELVILALALKVSIEWLAGQEDNRDPVLWDVLAEPQRSEQLLHLMAEYEEKTGEMIVWAEGLLCSLMPPEFAHEYHKAHFAELDQLGLLPEKKRLIEIYDGVGHARRRRLFDAQAGRAWTLTQLVFLSELEAIARGAGKYKRIGKRLRRKCLDDLAQIVGDASSGIGLVIVKDEDAPDIKNVLQGYDRLSVNGKDFTQWSYRWGKVAWSEHAAHIRAHRKLLEEFQHRAAYRQRREVSDLLNGLRAMLE